MITVHSLYMYYPFSDIYGRLVTLTLKQSYEVEDDDEWTNG